MNVFTVVLYLFFDLELVRLRLSLILWKICAHYVKNSIWSIDNFTERYCHRSIMLLNPKISNFKSLKFQGPEDIISEYDLT